MVKQYRNHLKVDAALSPDWPVGMAPVVSATQKAVGHPRGAFRQAGVR